MGSKTVKNIYIMTRRAGYNPGSLLQAYAMQQSIAKLGFDNRIINYNEYQWRWKIRPYIENALYIVLRVLSYVNIKIWPKEYTRLRYRRVQRGKFDNFQKKYLQLTEKKYRNSRSISRDLKKTDVCICGSDQIWHPRLFDPAMFLDFANEKCARTIAYAPSLGLDKIETRREEIRNLILDIDYISAREAKGVEQIRDLTGRTTNTVLDPTFLLDRFDWDLIKVAPEYTSPYILCYFLGSEQLPIKFLSDLKDATGYNIKVIQMYYNITPINGDSLFTVDPTEFIGLIANAEYICTDSFHCVIFSIIYERQFYCFEKIKTITANSNHRLRYLVSLFNLSHRLCPPHSSLANSRNCDHIDYEQVNGLLKREKEKSLLYLKNSILGNSEVVRN